MPKIVWEGNQPWGKLHPEQPIPDKAVPVRRPDDIFTAAIPYMIPPCILCTLAVYFKTRAFGAFLFNPWFIPVSFILGFAIALPVHEYLHAICYPKSATVYVGLSLGKLRAYAVSFFPISRRRFIIMSLAPAVPGIVALFVFILCPPASKILQTLCIVPAYMSLISPAPDYLDIHCVLKQVPRRAMVQASNDSLFWF